MSLSLSACVVIYLNNRPFVLRELDQALRNMSDFAGIDAARLSGIESRMKVDIIEEADSNYGNILVHDEIELGEIRACWNSVHESNVKTSREVYEQLIKASTRAGTRRLRERRARRFEWRARVLT